MLSRWSEIQKLIEKEFPDLRIRLDVRKEWASTTDDHRAEIRAALGEAREFSISHCPMAGGYVALNPGSSLKSLGLDLEVFSRIRKPVVERIRNPKEEFPQHLPFQLLWSAKEAAFKSLKGREQPSVVGHAITLHWREIAPDLWRFSFFSQTFGNPSFPYQGGYIWLEGEMLVGLCLKARQLAVFAS